MDNICVLLILFLIVPTIEAKCSYENGVNRFGDNCGFMCHCEGNRECDVVTGECSSGCARGWYGPGCQYRDILRNKYSKFSDTSRILFVTDGDPNTCFQQVKSSRTKNLSWSVRLDSNETINEIQIATTAKSLAYFKNFEVFVGYIPFLGRDETVKQQMCFRQGVSIPKSTTFTVLCEKPVIGNYVKIEFAESQNELELCDVKINGGRNLAFNRTVSQVSKTKSCANIYCSAEASVNGQTKSSWWLCSYTAKEQNPWLKVDIGYQMKIWSVQIVSYIGHGQKNLPYVVDITADTNEASTFSTNELSNDTQIVALNLIGRFVTISINGESKLAVCEISVFGDCPEKRCGYNCEKECNCEYATLWEKISGNCSISCNKKDKDDQCNTSCDNGYYGQNCSKTCSNHCRHGNTYCNAVNGTCIHGCRRGWKEPLCETCDPGSYGQNCFKKCSDHCKHGNKYCNKVNGKCTHGCMDGWKAPLCDQACDAGSHGQHCEEKCSEHCAGGSRNCNTTTGYCEKGCQPGWTGHLCVNECGPGMFGENCQEKCSTTCKNGLCSHLDGGCSNGCKPGYHGNMCEQKCPDGKFGEECKENCSSSCKNNMCDHVTGNCTNGYKPSYKGNTCGENKILSDTNPCTGCHETPKPNIVLICVGILCAIVIVYATVITILFKRKSTHNVKDGTNVSCSGRSNDDAITNKTNKTETVTTEAATEATTELARVNINAIDDESHQYTDLTPDTENVEAAYETIQIE